MQIELIKIGSRLLSHVIVCIEVCMYCISIAVRVDVEKLKIFNFSPSSL